MASGGSGSVAAECKRNIARKLRIRDRHQSHRYSAVITRYNQLLERANVLRQWRDVCNPSSVPSSPSDVSDLQVRHQEKVTAIHRQNGQLAEDFISLRKKLEEKEPELELTQGRMAKLEHQREWLDVERRKLSQRVLTLEQVNRSVREEYEGLRGRCWDWDQQLRALEMENAEIIRDLMELKARAARAQNHRIEEPQRVQQCCLQKDLAVFSNTPVCIDTDEEKESHPPIDVADELKMRTNRDKLFRSASVSLPRSSNFLQNIKQLFVRRRGSSSVSEVSDPIRICVSATVPTISKQCLEVHDGEVNAVQFSPNSNLLATGGSDRTIKLWDMVRGTLQNPKALVGSNDGITSLEFDPLGSMILAGSYDNSARLWSLDTYELKHTLSGHSGKVTAAKFKSYLRQVVTGSYDGTLRIWDLHKEACVSSIAVNSRCSDVICSDYFIVSGHMDKKIRFWDCRTQTISNEIHLQEKVTSLDMSGDRTQLLSLSRDDLLRVMDMRMNNVRKELRAEGFKCGTDWTKAIFSPDGNYVVSGSIDGVLYIWNVDTEKLETSLVGEHRATVNAISWSPSGDYVVSVDRAKRATLWTDF
uniref:Autophagy-related protein 16-1-like protein n=1 Tax=Callorhinchus milii TaxID=7868 RepID=V9KLL2_CALMI